MSEVKHVADTMRPAGRTGRFLVFLAVVASLVGSVGGGKSTGTLPLRG